MVQASKDWQWIYSEEVNRLLVDLGEFQLVTPFKLRQLTEDTRDNPAFSIQDAAFYNQVFQYLQQFGVWREPEICQIALNATAAKYYLLPMQAKSWFFKPYQGGTAISDAIVVLKSAHQQGEFLLVDCGAEASLCINLQGPYHLDEHLVLEPFQAIKVLNDRIHPLIITQKSAQSA
ncbi:cell division protein ZapC domain-containing protein [Pseudoalteromonas fenneropenaei]|uniref:Cell division protein ZapC domain-containing protein n=1 Tax=Pseudoalteromonas fenneropenaei TaxID=1737459 RepID=A0ABV7CHL5_9GAMM